MIKTLIRGFFAGAIANVIYGYLGGFIVGLITLPPPIPQAIVVGAFVALIVWLLERFGL